MLDTAIDFLRGLKEPEKAVRYVAQAKFGRTTDYFDKKEKTQYLLWLHKLYQQIDEVPGHIVELGTGPGTNAIIFGHLIQLYADEEIRRYYGFDTFEGYTDEGLEEMPYVNQQAYQDFTKESVHHTLAECGVEKETTLIQGDLVETLPEFIDEKLHPKKSPGQFHVSLVYVDCNSYRATKAGLNALHDHMSPSGIICIDELKQGGETKALKEYCNEHDLPFKKGSSPIAWGPYTAVD